MYAFRSTLITLINVILAFVAIIIGLRLVLRLLAANPATPFVNWIYSLSDFLVRPFRGIFPSQTIQTGNVLDVTALVALIIYTLFVFLVVAVINATIENTTHEHIGHHQPHFH